MSYIYGATCKARNFNVVYIYIYTQYIYGPTFGKAESRLFLFAAQCFNTESMQKVILWHSCVCKQFASYQGYPNYRWDLIWYAMVKRSVYKEK
jgi:hypothetical protein